MEKGMSGNTKEKKHNIFSLWIPGIPQPKTKTSQWEEIAWQLIKGKYPSHFVGAVEVTIHTNYGNCKRSADISDLCELILKNLQKGGVFKSSSKVMSLMIDKVFDPIIEVGTIVYVRDISEGGEE